MCTLSAHLTSFLRISSFLWNLVILGKFTFFAIKFLELLNKSMSSENTNESMLPFAIGKPYLQNVYWEGNQVSNSRGFHQIWLSISSSQRDIEQELAKSIFLQQVLYFSAVNCAFMPVTSPHYLGQVEMSEPRFAQSRTLILKKSLGLDLVWRSQT